MYLVLIYSFFEIKCITLSIATFAKVCSSDASDLILRLRIIF